MRPKVTKTRTTIPGWKVDTSWVFIFMSFKGRQRSAYQGNRSRLRLRWLSQKQEFLENHADEVVSQGPAYCKYPAPWAVFVMNKKLLTKHDDGPRDIDHEESQAEGEHYRRASKLGNARIESGVKEDRRWSLRE